MAAPTTAPSRRRADPGRRPPDSRPAGRPALRVVPPNTLTKKGRQRRARRFGASLSAILVIAIFGVVAAHVVLTQRQFRLASLERSADAAEARYERLRLEVAQLEAPERVVAAAQALGMVPPATVTYLASTRVTTGAEGERANRQGEWATVKPHLAASKP